MYGLLLRRIQFFIKYDSCLHLKNVLMYQWRSPTETGAPWPSSSQDESMINQWVLLSVSLSLSHSLLFRHHLNGKGQSLWLIGFQGYESASESYFPTHDYKWDQHRISFNMHMFTTGHWNYRRGWSLSHTVLTNSFIQLVVMTTLLTFGFDLIQVLIRHLQYCSRPMNDTYCISELAYC